MASESKCADIGDAEMHQEHQQHQEQEHQHQEHQHQEHQHQEHQEQEWNIFANPSPKIELVLFYT